VRHAMRGLVRPDACHEGLVMPDTCLHGQEVHVANVGMHARLGVMVELWHSMCCAKR